MEPLKEFFQNPKTRTAAILSGCKNISAAERVDAHTLRAVDWGVTLHVKEREIADDIRAVGIRAHFLATVERPGEENVFPVNESEIWEDPFEWNISFRKNAECSWLQWNIAKQTEPGNGDSKGAVSEGGRYSAADGFLMLV